MKQYAMGFDIGTGSAKALLVDGQGRVAARYHHAHETIVDAPGRQEQDMDLWWREFCVAACQFVHAAGEAASITCVGVTGLVPGCCPVDGQGRALGRALLHTDVRAGGELARANRALGGGVTHGHLLPKVLWLQKNEPSRFDRVRNFLAPHGYLVRRLTGADTMDYDSAAMVGGVFHEEKLCWRVDALAELGLSADLFPAPRPAGGVAGEVTEAAARETGLAPGTRVIVGVGDTFASMLGGGAWEAGHLMLYLGTSATLLYAEGEPEHYVNTTHYGPGKAQFVGRILSFGESATHLRRLLGGPGWRELDAALESVPPGAEGLWYFPHYKLQGDTAFFGPDAEHVLGLRGCHEPGHLFCALLEGIGYNVRRNLAGLTKSARRVNMFGGGANSRPICQLLANVLGRGITVNPKSATALGIAFLAALSTGMVPSYDTLGRLWLGEGEAIFPDPEKTVEYDRLYNTYETLRCGLLELETAMARQREGRMA